MFERANFFRDGGGSSSGSSGAFDFLHERGTDDSRICESAKNGDMSRQRDSEADRERKFCRVSGAANQRGQIFRKVFLRAGDSRARDEIQKSAAGFGDSVDS